MENISVFWLVVKWFKSTYKTPLSNKHPMSNNTPPPYCHYDNTVEQVSRGTVLSGHAAMIWKFHNINTNVSELHWAVTSIKWTWSLFFMFLFKYFKLGSNKSGTLHLFHMFKLRWKKWRKHHINPSYIFDVRTKRTTKINQYMLVCIGILLGHGCMKPG